MPFILLSQDKHLEIERDPFLEQSYVAIAYIMMQYNHYNIIITSNP